MSFGRAIYREEEFKDSPFTDLAKKEGFGIWAIHSSYFILRALTQIEENYFEVAEDLARSFPDSVEPLYKILREGMYEEAKNHMNILYAITNVTVQVTGPRDHSSNAYNEITHIDNSD